MSWGKLVRAFGFGVSGTAVIAMVAASGCMPHPGQTRTDALALERERSTHAEQQVRTLEARVSELEAALAKQREQEASQRQAQDETLAKLDQLIAAQEHVAQRVEQLQPDPTSPPAAAATAAPANDADQALRVYLEQLIQRAQSGAPPWRGGLSFEKREALRVLLDSARGLDAANPVEL